MILLHFVLVLLFAAIVITFCVSITFSGDYYILRRNKTSRPFFVQNNSNLKKKKLANNNKSKTSTTEKKKTNISNGFDGFIGRLMKLSDHKI